MRLERKPRRFIGEGGGGKSRNCHYMAFRKCGRREPLNIANEQLKREGGGRCAGDSSTIGQST